MRAENIGAQKLLGIEDRAIDVRFRRKVDDRVDAGPNRVANGFRIANVAVRELIASVYLDVAQVGRIARIGHRIEVDDLEGGIFA